MHVCILYIIIAHIKLKYYTPFIVCNYYADNITLVSLARPLPPLHFLQTDVIDRGGRVW